MSVDVLPYGDRAWLLDNVADPVSLAGSLRTSDWPVPIEVVVGARTCLLRFDGPKPDRTVIESVLGASNPPLERDDSSMIEVIGVTYDGADLAVVAQQAGLAVAEVIRLHGSITYRTSFLGFAPGFAYLTGLPPPLHLPRRSVPRLRVPAGSVAIAHEYTAIYPRESPGGWLLLGRTSERLFDLDCDPPSRLTPGARVRFVALP